MASPEVHRRAAREEPPRWRRRRLVVVALSFSVLVQARAASSFVVVPPTATLTCSAASLATTNAKLDRLYSTTPDVPVASEATTSPKQRQQLRPPPFRRRNALSRTFPFPSPSVAAAWQRTVPPVDPLNILGVVGPIAGGGGTRRQIRRGVLGKDVRVAFEDPADGARALVEGCFALGGGDSSKAGEKDRLMEQAQRHLAEVLEFYQDIVSSSPSSPPSDRWSGADNQPTTTTTKKRCVARIVSSRGPVGTKCPRWHVDHVPVRLIMSLVGPGCVYLPESMEEGAPVDPEGRGDGDSARSEDSATATVQRGLVNRDALNHLDVDDTVQANRILVPDERCAPHAHACEAVLLVGREWEDDDDDANGPSDGGGGVAAAAHRSPDLGALEGRVLLTVDVVPEWE